MESNNYDYDHSNEVLVAIYVGEELIYVTPPMYYRMNLGNLAIKKEIEDERKS